jgi:hypothetical protein
MYRWSLLLHLLYCSHNIFIYFLWSTDQSCLLWSAVTWRKFSYLLYFFFSYMTLTNTFLRRLKELVLVLVWIEVQVTKYFFNYNFWSFQELSTTKYLFSTVRMCRSNPNGVRHKSAFDYVKLCSGLSLSSLFIFHLIWGKIYFTLLTLLLLYFIPF